MRLLVGLLVLTAAACSPQSSGENCTSQGTVTVSITDNVSNNAICDAAVTATPKSGGSAATLTPQGGGTACSYFTKLGPGTYTIAVSRGGYQPYMTTLNIQTDGCAVFPANETFELMPTM
jgi:hypothetical protein